MPIASFVLGGIALLLTLTAFFGTFVPGVPSWLMAIVSLLAPLASLIGVVLGGVGLSRAKEENVGTGLATGALVLNVVVLFPALFVGIACGACNMMCASAQNDARNRREARGGATPSFFDVDAAAIDPNAPRPGTVAPPPIDPMDPSGSGAAPPSPNDPTAPGVDPSQPVDPAQPVDPDPAQPPPMFE